MTHKI